jgi:hypothetical protein
VAIALLGAILYFAIEHWLAAILIVGGILFVIYDIRNMDKSARK